MSDFRLTMPTAGMLVRLAAIGAVMLCLALLFAYTGGWLSPGRLTQDRMMEAFQSDNGGHPGFRRNHAKGVCVSGWFESNGQAAALSKATLFKPGRVPVIGRFALAGGMPFQADMPNTVRSMALRFLPPSGEEWRTGMNDIPVFVVNSARGFYEQLVAAAPDPATGKPDPAKMQAFLANRPTPPSRCAGPRCRCSPSWRKAQRNRRRATRTTCSTTSAPRSTGTRCNGA